MQQSIVFRHQTRGAGRPQIVLVGNGLERKSGQPAWDTLVDMITVDDCIRLSEQQKKDIPFPLLYSLLSTHSPACSSISQEDIDSDEHRLKSAMKQLSSVSNALLEVLPTLEANHIFTTNYSYCLEKAFYPTNDFSLPNIRSNYRFNLNSKKRNEKPLRETNYRLHSGYLAKNASGANVGLWHIHGECSVPRGVVLGHDRYGRLLSRIESICSNQKYKNRDATSVYREFSSWPELFLYGDIYIVGFGFWECEFDLWWLLRRKQRERFGDGRVYFYDMNREMDARKFLLLAHGVELCDIESCSTKDYDQFYMNALIDIKNRIALKRGF